MAVPAFFMLSGFVLAFNYADRFQQLRSREFFRFLLLRFARLYPVHIVSLLIVLAMVIVGRRIGYQLTDEGYAAKDFLLNLLLVHTWVPNFTLNWNYPAWSISSEWFAYLIFPVAVTGFLRHLTTASRAAYATIASISLGIATMLWWHPWPFYVLVLVVPTFFAGASSYFFVHHQLRSNRLRLGRWIPEVLLITAVGSTFAPSAAIVTSMLLVCSLGLIIALAWLGGQCHSLWTNWPIIYLGEVSYSLYMTHTLAQKVLYRLLPSARFESADIQIKITVMAIYIFTALIFCLCTYYLVERPCRIYFKKISRRIPESNK